MLVVSERAERIATLLLGGVVVMGVEVALIHALVGEGNARTLTLAAASLATILATITNAAPRERRGRAGIKATLVGFAVTVTGMSVSSGLQGAAGAAQGLVVCFLACTWLIPQMAIQSLTTTTLTRLRNRFLGQSA